MGNLGKEIKSAALENVSTTARMVVLPSDVVWVASQLGGMSPLKNVRAHIGQHWKMVIRASTGRRMVSERDLYLLLHLPGNHTNNAGLGQNLFCL